MPPAVVPQTDSEMINLRLSSNLIDELDAAARADGTTCKVIVTRPLRAPAIMSLPMASRTAHHGGGRRHE